ncbi:soluble lytic murein transglycosylase [Rubidibacter lacunae KORDI 51-2]|uniref:Soluble lytic murein transglycosylase n=1 Tax=Rubidibacter lacunae KORDI 51-2 TaxID=582515 RepID=U5DAH6_9CHRO|nr:transglycosylase SLT domain-containing protein [Rubidibacter lacunae]ERN41568.1 soluble lytic murein transglycosylase [Rubidibacter lacunae KORDI 51-2]
MALREIVKQQSQRQRQHHPANRWCIGTGIVLATLLSILACGERGTRQETGSSVKPARETVLPLEPEQSLISVVLPQDLASPDNLAAAGDRLSDGRIRYRLAVEAIARGDGDTALVYLDQLATDYPELADYARLQRAIALNLTGDRARARALLVAMVRAPDTPVLAEAFYQLGRLGDETAHDKLLARFPHSPRAIAIARERLSAEPNSFQLQLLLATYDPAAADVAAIRDRLARDFAERLMPADWEAIADGYWARWQYGQAGNAYPNAPTTPRNLYRAARGKHIAGQTTAAIAAYQRLFAEFPTAEITGFGRRRYALLLPVGEAIAQLDLAIAEFPKEAPAALRQKADLLDNAGDTARADVLRDRLLSDYPESDAAAELRWERAQQHWQSGDLANAQLQAQAIFDINFDNSIAPKAGYWFGKWSAQRGDRDRARWAFETVLARYPESYYAWRSAVQLGWDVGTFETLRARIPEIVKPDEHLLPPAGSIEVQELYRLGFVEDAWRHWKTATGDRADLSVSEQFTDGMLDLAVGNYLRGIQQVGDLRDRDEPGDRDQWQLLRAHPGYWHVLFPFPYEIPVRTWSKTRQLNPLLVLGLIRQESAFEADIASSAGAQGLMQIIPSTGKWVADKIDLKTYSLSDPEDNIRLGTWYLRYTHREYDDRSVLAVASYNAGPGNVAKWVRRYGYNDPDVFVENIPFSETKGYVESVLGNYWNYLRLYDPTVAQKLARHRNSEL